MSKTNEHSKKMKNNNQMKSNKQQPNEKQKQQPNENNKTTNKCRTEQTRQGILLLSRKMLKKNKEPHKQ